PSFAGKYCPGLEPVLELKTRILRVETHAKELNGYQSNNILHGRRKIAVLPFGYGDIPYYLLVKEGQVLIRGARCPVIGKVCMCHVLVDISNLPEVGVGDEVVIIGRQGSEIIRCEELAKKAGLSVLNCESICFLDRNVRRKYSETAKMQMVKSEERITK
ncbi:MAG: alanine racemase C-terminal domain-containing protein, partial [Eubacteriales bacterium]